MMHAQIGLSLHKFTLDKQHISLFSADDCCDASMHGYLCSFNYWKIIVINWLVGCSSLHSYATAVSTEKEMKHTLNNWIQIKAAKVNHMGAITISRTQFMYILLHITCCVVASEYYTLYIRS